MPSNIFLEFFSVFGWFSKLHRNDRLKVFGRPNLSGHASFCPPRPCLKCFYSSSTHSKSVFRLPLSCSLNLPLPNLTSSPISLPQLSHLQISSKIKTLISFWNPNCSFINQLTMASSRVDSNRKRKPLMQEDSPSHYDHSGYLSREAFNCFSNRNINFGRIPNFSSLDFMNFNQIMRRLKWQSFARLNNPFYPSLIRHFYGNLTKPSKGSLHLVATLGDVEIELDPSSMCRILGVHDEGAEVFDSNSWPIVENFNPQECIRRLCKSNALILKPKSIDLTLEARLILLFV